RIFPDTCASTVWPFSRSTLTIALGNVSVTTPSTSIPSSLDIVVVSPLYISHNFTCVFRYSKSQLSVGDTISLQKTLSYFTRDVWCFFKVNNIFLLRSIILPFFTVSKQYESVIQMFDNNCILPCFTTFKNFNNLT